MAESPHLAGTLGLMMGATGIIIASLDVKETFLKTMLVTLSSLALIILIFLFLILFSLTIRDYANHYPDYKNHLFGIKWLKY